MIRSLTYAHIGYIQTKSVDNSVLIVKERSYLIEIIN